MKNDDLIIIRSDGGICSQIDFVALGQYFADKGYEVKYDLSWFDECGKSTDGRFARNYDMPKAFPDLKLEIATTQEIALYKRKYRYSGNAPLLNAPPHCILMAIHKSEAI